MNEIETTIQKALEKKKEFEVGELYVMVSSKLFDKISMQEFNSAYQKVKR